MLDAGHIQKNSFCVFNSKSTLAAAENITVNKKPASSTDEHKVRDKPTIFAILA